MSVLFLSKLPCIVGLAVGSTGIYFDTVSEIEFLIEFVIGLTSLVSTPVFFLLEKFVEIGENDRESYKIS